MQHRTTLFSLVVLLLAPVSARAQELPAPRLPVASSDSATAPIAAGPRVELARAGFAAPSREARTAIVDDVVAPPFVQASRERGRTLMLVGGAIFLGGLLIGDDVGTAIAVGGLVIGVWGFWQLIR